MANSYDKNNQWMRVLALGAGITALATAMPQAASAQADEEGETRRLQTVTTTATKREQTLQDVPVAVSVVGEEVIERSEIQDLIDLQSVVPSLTVTQRADAASTNFFIRGFGNGALNPGIEPSVGVFIDGVYRSRSAAQISDLPNVQRVEVLRGPQSTLFGKNASAGVVSVVTRAPQFEQSGSVSASIGNFNLARVRGDITGPLSENVAFSLSGSYNTRDGFFDDVVRDTDTNNRDRWGIRGQLLIEPSEDLSLRFIADYDEVDEECCTGTNFVTGPVGPLITALGGQVAENDPFSFQSFTNIELLNDIQNSGLSLQADYDVGFAELTSITAYRNHERAIVADSDFTGADLSTTSGEIEINTFTQELRLTSTGDGPIDWMVGGFYFDESFDRTSRALFGDDIRAFADVLSSGFLATAEQFAFGVPVGTFFNGGEGEEVDLEMENQAWSIFGTLDWHLTDQLTATVGLNYTEDEKDFSGQAVFNEPFGALDLATIEANTMLPVTLLSGLQFIRPFQDFPNIVENGQTKDDDLTYTLRLAYDVNENLNVYGSFATGFKASSVNISRDSRPLAADLPALVAAGIAVNNLGTGSRATEPESSEVIELGVKGSYDNVSFNLAIFDQKIENFQTSVLVGVDFAFLNADEQATTGIEADLTWAATDNLTLNFAGTFLDPVYESFPNSAFGDIS